MPKIKVNDINLYYEEYGQGEPVVFIAGFTADHNAWNNIRDEYAKQYRVIVLDNRGTGQTEAPDYPYTIEMMADDVAGLCKHLHLEPAHFIGNSMGGFIVQQIAYKYPKLVKSLVISNSFLRLENIKLKLVVEGKVTLLEAGMSPIAIDKTDIGWAFSEEYLQRPGVLDLMLKYRLENPFPMTVANYKNQSNALFTFDSSPWAHKITQLCLVIGTDADLIFPRKQVKKLATTIPNAEFHCITDGVAHVPHLEQPKKFNRLVKKSLAQNTK